MKSIFKYLLLFITSGCFAQDTCKVSGQIDDPRGDLQGIWLVHDGNQEKIPLKGGEFVYCETLAQPKLYELVVEYKHNGHQEWFYLSRDALKFEISTRDSTLKFTVISPQISKDYEDKLLGPVESLNRQTGIVHRAYLAAKKQHSGDTTELKDKELEAKRKAFNLPQAYIKANPDSPLSIIALNMLGNGEKNSLVSAADLDKLYNSLTDSVKDSPEGREYAAKLKKLKSDN